jgi:Protein of unknown function (DUF3562)
MSRDNGDRFAARGQRRSGPDVGARALYERSTPIAVRTASGRGDLSASQLGRDSIISLWVDGAVLRLQWVANGRGHRVSEAQADDHRSPGDATKRIIVLSPQWGREKRCVNKQLALLKQVAIMHLSGESRRNHSTRLQVISLWGHASPRVWIYRYIFSRSTSMNLPSVRSEGKIWSRIARSANDAVRAVHPRSASVLHLCSKSLCSDHCSEKLMSALHITDTDDANQQVIESIAKETHHPLPVVKRVYEAELARIASAAKIVDYVPLFAARRTRDVLARGGA